MPASYPSGSVASVSTRASSPRIPCVGPRPRLSIGARGTYARCNFCSVTRHTAREHPTEAKVHYPFHPQFGESVIVRRRLVTNNVAMAVILQPDGSLAFLPAWMLDESAARFTIHQSPTFSVPFLQSLRAEIDALLTSLPSDSKAGDDGSAATIPSSPMCERSALIACVRWRTKRSRTRCCMSCACCSGVFTGTLRTVGRRTASQHAAASTASFLLRLT